MPKFQIKTESGTYQVEADDENHAVAALNQMFSNQYTGPEDANGVPEGMVLDPKTGAMMDTRKMAEEKGGSLAGAALKGMPFIGQWADEIVGGGDPVQTELARQMQAKAERDNPKTARAAQVATGATAIPAAVAYGGGALAGRTGLSALLAGLGYGTTTGTAEGFVSGLGSGKGQLADRLPQGGTGALVGGGIGGLTGMLAPVLSSVIGKGAQNVLDALTVNRNAAKMGITRPAMDAVTNAMRADDTLGINGAKNIMQGGGDAMLADSGGAARALLDVATQKAGSGARIATKAVEERASKAGNRLNTALDLVLGSPKKGINTAAKDIAQSSQAARKQAYDFAHSQPINYASPEGAAIEDVFSRIPSNLLGPAVQEANDAMKAAGKKNLQIMANIADDGTVTFKEMPNVQQLDELKKALGAVAEKNVDQFGRKTSAGVRAANLAKELRQAIGDAVPGYNKAVQLGGDKISEDNALKLGYDLLSPSTTREIVMDGVDGITAAERKQLKLGIRQKIDDTIANVTQAMTDHNMDAREAAKALKDMSSRAAREKMKHALGERDAEILFKELDKANAALSLRASQAQNSKTFARQALDNAVTAGRDGVMDTLNSGRPLEAGRRMIQAVTGATPEAARAADEELYSQIATLLTKPRGPDAMRTLQALERAYGKSRVNQALAQQVGRGAAGAVLVPSYQLGSQAVTGR